MDKKEYKSKLLTTQLFIALSFDDGFWSSTAEDVKPFDKELYGRFVNVQQKQKEFLDAKRELSKMISMKLKG
jgi:hypothetical protein